MSEVINLPRNQLEIARERRKQLKRNIEKLFEKKLSFAPDNLTAKLAELMMEAIRERITQKTVISSRIYDLTLEFYPDLEDKMPRQSLFFEQQRQSLLNVYYEVLE